MNAFMVWSQHQRRQYGENHIHHAQISKQLGQKWKCMTTEEKQPYYDEAERLRVLHKAEYPDYKYKPKKKVAGDVLRKTASNTGRVTKKTSSTKNAVKKNVLSAQVMKNVRVLQPSLSGVLAASYAPESPESLWDTGSHVSKLSPTRSETGSDIRSNTSTPLTTQQYSSITAEMDEEQKKSEQFLEETREAMMSVVPAMIEPKLEGQTAPYMNVTMKQETVEPSAFSTPPYSPEPYSQQQLDMNRYTVEQFETVAVPQVSTSMGVHQSATLSSTPNHMGYINTAPQLMNHSSGLNSAGSNSLPTFMGESNSYSSAMHNQGTTSATVHHNEESVPTLASVEEFPSFNDPMPYPLEIGSLGPNSNGRTDVSKSEIAFILNLLSPDTETPSAPMFQTQQIVNNLAGGSALSDMSLDFPPLNDMSYDSSATNLLSSNSNNFFNESSSFNTIFEPNLSVNENNVNLMSYNSQTLGNSVYNSSYRQSDPLLASACI